MGVDSKILCARGGHGRSDSLVAAHRRRVAAQPPRRCLRLFVCPTETRRRVGSAVPIILELACSFQKAFASLDFCGAPPPPW